MRWLLAWAAFLPGAVLVTYSIITLHVDGLTALGAALLVLWAWGIGAFRKAFWVMDIDGSHPDALGSFDRMDRGIK